MARARAAVLYAAVAALLLACLYGGYAVTSTPYSDQELRASIVDTWQAQALFTLVVLAGIAALTALSVAVAYGTRDRVVRRLRLLAILLSITSAALVFSGHMALTERATLITGHSFGFLYGLF